MIRSSLILCVLLVSNTSRSEDYFASKIEPLLRKRCFECHSHEQSIEAGLALDSRSGWEIGGDSGTAVVPGKPEQSLLIKKVRWSDAEHEMPPDEKLPAEEIALLEEWVKLGAPDPRKLTASKSDALDWWSLKPLKPVAIPGSDVHPIDAFIQEKLTANDLKPSRPADRRTLIRRLYLDLHGFLPTPQEVHTFETDNDPQAWEKLVDRMLDSPRYGERWARHWLDVIHYADSHGCEHDV